MDQEKRLYKAYLDSMDTVAVLIPYHHRNGESADFWLETGDGISKLEVQEAILLETEKKYICKLQKTPPFGQIHYIINEFGEKTDLQIGSVIRTSAFDEMHYFNGFLGCSYSSESSSFTLWAPSAAAANLITFHPGTSESKKWPMIRKEKGAWVLEIKENMDGIFYKYEVCVNKEWRQAVDPYAVAVSKNSEWGVIVDLNKTRKERISRPVFSSPNDAIIYEVHIRDATSHPKSGIDQKGTYVGFSASPSMNDGGQVTGLNYIADLGPTHLELLPFNDFGGIPDENTDNAYNWGYNPLFFNVPEGSYSSNPNDPYSRITELKNMIDAIHHKGLAVIMDVVYNHVYIRETSSFEQLVPGYYFRHDEFGMPSNGTGVGNDFASDRRMGRKFILDSVRFWLEEYKVDGFRLDLMGILDIQTMSEVKKLAEELHPGCLILGEGWDLNTPLPQEEKAALKNAKKMPGISFFNDFFRDTIKGSIFDLYNRGYALGKSRLVPSAIEAFMGSSGCHKGAEGIFLSPRQSINYVESHDNHTLWDKINFCFPGEFELNQKRHRLATSITILAMGIPFLHAGQEFFRTKKGIDNSYKEPDSINWLDWDRCLEFQDNVNYIKDLIAFRKMHAAFRMSGHSEIKEHIEIVPIQGNTIGFHYRDVGHLGKWNHIFIVLNPDEKKKVKLPEIKNRWMLLGNGQSMFLENLQTAEGKWVEAEAISMMIYVA
ncbi:type I pullulanase [Falsibacillus pallidus]|uniref:Pullulanase n=1 Tax=Falsibacillus pallidus TaxID=493781 RepID=A0A370GM24_9BACI|nr:type I pullulanase [Falsibacillus pallidus]RDI44326.1 pullulanase [Falsibacillus pallidus]